MSEAGAVKREAQTIGRAKIIAIPVSPDAVREAVERLRESISKEEEFLRKAEEHDRELYRLYREYVGQIRDLIDMVDRLSNELFSKINTEYSSLIVPPVVFDYSLKTRYLSTLNIVAEAVRNLNHSMQKIVSSIINSPEITPEKREMLRKTIETYFNMIQVSHIAVSLVFERVWGTLSLTLPPDKRSSVANMMFIQRDLLKPK